METVEKEMSTEEHRNGNGLNAEVEEVTSKTKDTNSNTEEATSKTKDTNSNTEEVTSNIEEATSNIEEATSKTKDTNSNTEKVTSNTEETTPKTDVTVPVTEEVKSKILEQMEYYFGNYNLPRDKFLTEETKKDEGWIPMATLFSFKRLASLTTDSETVFNAIEKSLLLEVDESRLKVRRSANNPLPEHEGDLRAESMPRTVYVKGFPKDGSIDLDVLQKYFKEHGPVETIYLRNFHDKIKNTAGFKGSVLVVFPTRVLAETFLQKFDLKYKNTPLLRMWHTDYLEEKKKEIEERIQRKEERKAFVENEKNEIDITMPKGAYLHMSNVAPGSMREDIKASLLKITDECAFIGFHKENVEGYLRFKTEGCNVKMLSELQGKLKVKGIEISLRLVEGEEEEEQMKLAAEARLNSRISRPGKRSFNRGRGGYRGPQNKRRRSPEYEFANRIFRRNRSCRKVYESKVVHSPEVLNESINTVISEVICTSPQVEESIGTSITLFLAIYIENFPQGIDCNEEHIKDFISSLTTFKELRFHYQKWTDTESSVHGVEIVFDCPLEAQEFMDLDNITYLDKTLTRFWYRDGAKYEKTILQRYIPKVKSENGSGYSKEKKSRWRRLVDIILVFFFRRKLRN